MLKKKIILILIVVAIVGYGIFVVNHQVKVEETNINNLDVGEIKTEKGSDNSEVVKEVVAPKQNLQNNEISSEEGQKINVILAIPQREFNITITEGATVYDMLSLIGQKENINFVFKNFSGLGFYVDSIDGVKSGSGKFWIYYINGKKAETGISNYKLKAGDRVLWQLEEEI